MYLIQWFFSNFDNYCQYYLLLYYECINFLHQNIKFKSFDSINDQDLSKKLDEFRLALSFRKEEQLMNIF